MEAAPYQLVATMPESMPAAYRTWADMLDWLVGRKRESSGEPDYEILGSPGEPDRGPLFTCRLIEEQIFSHENGRFRNWWYADMYDDLLVFYSPLKDEENSPTPVKAWRRYDQVWREE